MPAIPFSYVFSCFSLGSHPLDRPTGPTKIVAEQVLSITSRFLLCQEGKGWEKTSMFQFFHSFAGLNACLLNIANFLVTSYTSPVSGLAIPAIWADPGPRWIERAEWALAMVSGSSTSLASFAPDFQSLWGL